MILIGENDNRKIEEICDRHYDNIHRVVTTAIKKNIRGPRRSFLLDNLNIILKGRPQELLDIFIRYKDFCIQRRTLPWNSKLDKAFSYENFRSRKRYNLYDLADELNVKVCPYCNRQYTFTVVRDAATITRPQFDHFFCVKHFPLLSLSFYNLIPSCYICNATLKRDEIFTLDSNIHPYLTGFNDDFKFTYNALSPEAVEGLSDEFEISYLVENTSIRQPQINGNAEIFELKSIYNHHVDHVREIVRKYHITGGNYLERLNNMFNLPIENKDELYLLAFGNYYSSENHELRPLAKFISDIYLDTFLVEKPDITP